MNINMKDIELVLEDGWVCIEDKITKETTKLLYDPRNENDINLIAQQITQMNDYNTWDLADDFAATEDWLLTLCA